MRTFVKCVILLLSLLPAMQMTAQKPTHPIPVNKDSIDSIGVQHVLDELNISVQRTPSEVRAQAPTQVIDARRIERTGAIQLSDAVQQMVGVTLKDYGGVGGMKTVSARGLGSQFSTLTIDGVAVSDAQNGQVDLGRYLLGNSTFVNFTHGQQEELLQTARVYAAGNVLNMETTEPSFLPGERQRLKVSMETGSFGYFSPGINWERKLTKKLTFTLWTNWLQSRGDYPFTLYYTHSRHDSSSIEHRTNSQMRMGTADANLFYHISQRSQLSVKVHYMQSYHALPGPVTYYIVRGSEHSEEQLFFGQAKWRWKVSDKIDVQALGKYQHSRDVYEDTANTYSITGRLRNEYRQDEGYLSAAVRYRLTQHLSLALSSDEALNTMNSNLAKNNDVQRVTSLDVLAASYTRTGFNLNVNLLGTFMHERAWTEPAGTLSRELYYRRLSPYLGFSVSPFGLHTTGQKEESSFATLLKPLRLRYFYKQTYRVPTFGEIYYVAMTRDLRPEQAHQHNLGLTYAIDVKSSHITLTLDGYRNAVTDKIVAMPVQNMYLWSMINFGQVVIRGLDAKLETFVPVGRWRCTLGLTYAYQSALDKSDSTIKSYNNQIPYTPRHSGGVSLWVENPRVDVGYDVTLVGDRYSMAQNTESSLVSGYADHSVTLSHKFLLRHGTLSLRARVLNLFNVQYEVVRSYPMMGRNYRLALIYDI